jgi:hypothetical protein
LPLFFNFVLEYTISRVQANQKSLKSNGSHQLLVYPDGVDILDGSIYNTEKQSNFTGH